MQFTKKAFFSLLFLGAGLYASAQVTTVRRYNPDPAPSAPQTYSMPEQNNAADAAARRRVAVSKVQGVAPTPAKSMTPKGLAPAQYSNDGPIPVEYVGTPNPATTLTVNGNSVERNVRKGKGQVGDLVFTPIAELHYVQFAVYCKNTPVDKAPAIEGLMLLWHEGSKCPGGDTGACYIVKGYNTADDAKSAVLQYKASKLDCWYNPALTGAAVEVIGVRS